MNRLLSLFLSRTLLGFRPRDERQARRDGGEGQRHQQRGRERLSRGDLGVAPVSRRFERRRFLRGATLTAG